MKRPSKLSGDDLAAFNAAVVELERAHGVQVARARRELDRLLAAVRRDGRPSKKRVISIHLEDWQVEAAKLVATIRGGTYQERIRAWVEAGLLAEGRSGGKREA